MNTDQTLSHSALLSSQSAGLNSKQLQSQPIREIRVPGSSVTNKTSKNTGTNETVDRVTLSPAGRQAAASLPQKTNDAQKEKQEPAESQPGKNAQQATKLDVEEQRAVEQLKQRDMEVRSHEQAHLANAGQYAAGGAQYTYQKGPDGRRYAIGGEVPIDISKESTPEATIQKMQTVREAALAPASPSSADRQIAASATQKEAQARQEMQKVNTEESTAEPSKEPASFTGTLSPENRTGPPSSPRQVFSAVA